MVELDDVLRIEITDLEKYYDDHGFLRFREVRKTVSMTVLELIAAICGDSIGYATPMHAMRHVEEYLNGERETYCERAVAMFNCDLKELIESAVRYWLTTPEYKRRRLIGTVSKWMEIEERDPVAGMTISLMYPESGP